MSDGISERANRPNPHRKLQNEYESLYSDDLDYSVAGTLNAHPRMNEEQHNPKSARKKLRGTHGVIFKEPLY